MRRAQPDSAIIMIRGAPFQSSPDACAGRNEGAMDSDRIDCGFNPRPTHAPGATMNFTPKDPDSKVSILARRMRRAQHGPWFRWMLRTMFQSSPDACAGRNPPPAMCSAELECFNPRPTHAPGATRLRLRDRTGAEGFNPRPTHAPGATIDSWDGGKTRIVSILARRMRRAQLPAMV